MASQGGGGMEIMMLLVAVGGFILLWPHLQGALGGAQIGAVDTAGGGKASDKGGTVTAGGGTGGINTGASADEIRERTRRMIAEITARAKRGGAQVSAGGGGTNISVQGKGAKACVNGKCITAFAEMGLDFSNVV